MADKTGGGIRRIWSQGHPLACCRDSWWHLPGCLRCKRGPAYFSLSPEIRCSAPGALKIKGNAGIRPPGGTCWLPLPLWETHPACHAQPLPGPWGAGPSTAWVLGMDPCRGPETVGLGLCARSEAGCSTVLLHCLQTWECWGLKLGVRARAPLGVCRSAESGSG